MRRLFIGTAVALNPQFAGLQQNLKKALSSDEITWVKDGLLHFTLRFLGKTPEPLVSPLVEKIGECLTQFPQFELTLDKLGVFGSRHHPETIWLGFSDFEPLRKIHVALEPEITALGFEPYRGNFVPHITLGRVRKTGSLKFFWQQFSSLTPSFSQIIPVDSFSLIQSRLDSSGPTYTTLKTWNLK